MHQFSNKKTLLYTYAHIALPIIALSNPKKFYNDISSRKGVEFLEPILRDLPKKAVNIKSQMDFQYHRKIVKTIMKFL